MPFVAAVWMMIPCESLPEIKFPAPAAVPPIVLFAASAVDVDPVLGVAEVDGAGEIGADVVALDEVAGGGRAGDPDPVGLVARDHVPGGTDAADRVAARADAHAVHEVAEVSRAVDVGADVVVADDGAVTEDVDPVLGVAGDDVALEGAGATDGAGRARGADPGLGVAAQRAAVCRKADDVAEDDVVAAGGDQPDAVLAARGDDVALAGERAADRARAAVDLEAVGRIAERGRAVRTDADVVAADLRPGGGDLDLDAVVEVPRDDVALAGAGAADRDVRRGLHVDAVVRVAGAGRRVARRVGPDVVADDHVAGAAVHVDPVVAEAVDHETADGRRAGRSDRQAVGERAGEVARELDQRRTGVAGRALRPGVEHHRVGDRLELRSRRDRLCRADGADLEFARLDARDRIRVQDELAQGALLQAVGERDPVVVGVVAAGVRDDAEAEAKVGAGAVDAGQRPPDDVLRGVHGRGVVRGADAEPLPAAVERPGGPGKGDGGRRPVDGVGLLGPHVVGEAGAVVRGRGEHLGVDDDPVRAEPERPKAVVAARVGPGRCRDQVARVDREVGVRVAIELDRSGGEVGEDTFADRHVGVAVDVVVERAADRPRRDRVRELGGLEDRPEAGDRAGRGGGDHVPRRDRRGHGVAEADRTRRGVGVADAAIGDVEHTEVGLALAAAARVRKRAREELDPHRLARRH